MTDESPSSADGQVYFQVWRRLMGGDIPASNMRLIDAAVQKLTAQIELLKAISAGGTQYFVRTTADDPGALQVVPDNITPTESQVCIGDVGIEGIEIGDYVRLVTINPDGMAELLDIRNAASGTVFSSAGDAVRALEENIRDMQLGMRKVIVRDYPGDEITLEPGVFYSLENLPTHLKITLNDALAATGRALCFMLAVPPQADSYAFDVEYFSGAAAPVWADEPHFDPAQSYEIAVMDGLIITGGTAFLRDTVLRYAAGLQAELESLIEARTAEFTAALQQETAARSASITLECDRAAAAEQANAAATAAEKLRAQQAEQAETQRAQAAEAALLPRAIAPSLLTNAVISQDALGVGIVITALLPASGLMLDQETVLPVASPQLAGLIPAESMAALAQVISDIESLKGLGGRRIGSFATKAALNSYVFDLARDNEGDWATVQVDESRDGASTRYYTIENSAGYLVWQFDQVTLALPVPYATQAIAGISRGVDAFGKIYYEDDHTASWVGANWVQENINNLAAQLTAAGQQLAQKADSTALTTHTGNATVHITAAERAAWNAAATYTAPTSGPLAGLSLSNALAYINQLLNGQHKDITLDVNTVKVPLS
jgi:hypothetical protein